jgi:drug/metabolite transporter (DMT)-like permease
VVGIILGFIGVALLVKARGASTGFDGQWAPTFAIITSGICWAGGSLYSKYRPSAASPWMNAAAQMFCGGLGLLFAGVVLGEPLRTDWSRISGRSVAALAYLIVFGSWIGFSAYVWLLKASTPARISTYAYVNPVIAVLLGWALLGERVTLGVLYGAAVILLGVAVISVPPGVFIGAVRRGIHGLRRWAGAGRGM